MLMSRNGLVHAMVLASSVFTFASIGCLSDEGANRPSEAEAAGSVDSASQTQRVRRYIESLGFSPDAIVDKGNDLVAEGDIGFPKDMALPSYANAFLAETFQYWNASAGAVSHKKVRNVLVRADNTAGRDFSSESSNLDYAIMVLNRSFSDLHFSRVTTTNQDILVYTAGAAAGDQTTAQASWPSAGNPGPTLQVFNGPDSAYFKMSDSMKRRVLTHELQHCLGVMHTNDGTTSNLVPNTPDAAHEEDFSVMHAPSDWYYSGRDIGWENALSRYDHMTLQYLYPYWRVQRAADVNGDKKADLVMVRASDNAVFFKLSNGTVLGSTVSAGTFGSQTGQFFTGDINGDGKSDLLFANGGTIQVRYSNGNGFGTVSTLVSGFGSTANGGQYIPLDFNGDGKTDILFVSYMNRTINVRVSTGSGLSSTTYTKTFGDSAGEFFVGDFNGDKKMDVLCANRPTQTLANPSVLQPHTVDIVYSNGTGFGSSSQLICGDCFGHISWDGIYFMGDFNGDGKDDIYFKSTDGTFYVALSTGSALGAVVASNVWGNTIDCEMHVGDFNGDGKADMFVVGRGGGAWLATSGGTSWLGGKALVSPGEFGDIAFGDNFL